MQRQMELLPVLKHLSNGSHSWSSTKVGIVWRFIHRSCMWIKILYASQQNLPISYTELPLQVASLCIVSRIPYQFSTRRGHVQAWYVLWLLPFTSKVLSIFHICRTFPILGCSTSKLVSLLKVSHVNVGWPSILMSHY